jgi:Glucose-regulated metallo-peptidase M90
VLTLDCERSGWRYPSRNRSYIRDYAYTNDREFSAVLAEYFFKSPDLLKEKDPSLGFGSISAKICTADGERPIKPGAASFLPLLEGSYDVTSVVRFATVNRWPQSGRLHHIGLNGYSTPS